MLYEMEESWNEGCENGNHSGILRHEILEQQKAHHGKLVSLKHVANVHCSARVPARVSVSGGNSDVGGYISYRPVL